MHSIDLNKYSLRTDLIIENSPNPNYNSTREYQNEIQIETTTAKEGTERYTTITFEDITDKDNFKNVEEIFIKELKWYINYLNINKNDTILVVGLGNIKSTPDSLGPETIKQILITKHLFELGEVEDSYQCVAGISPSVTANTGIETSELIKNVISASQAKALIVIDALAASSIKRLNKTIQITNTGIHPGSGVGNSRKELTYKTLDIPVIAIGIPTVVDAATIVVDTFKYLEQQFSFKYNNKDKSKYKLIPEVNIDYRQEKSILPNTLKKEILGEIGILSEEKFKKLIYEVLSPINYNLMVTPTEIDFLIEKLALLIGTGINKTLHKNYIPTKNK